MKLPAAIVASAFLLALPACDGAREDAGEKADNQTGAVDSEDSVQSGPAETMGERQDEAVESAAEAREAGAEALEEQAEAQREAADQQAEVLEQQAQNLRGE